MRVNGSASYFTAIASVNNRKANSVDPVLNSAQNRDTKPASKTATGNQEPPKVSLSAMIEASGRRTILSPQNNNANLSTQSRNALTHYTAIQNQLYSEEQKQNQQLLGLDLFV